MEAATQRRLYRGWLYLLIGWLINLFGLFGLFVLTGVLGISRKSLGITKDFLGGYCELLELIGLTLACCRRLTKC